MVGFEEKLTHDGIADTFSIIYIYNIETSSWIVAWWIYSTQIHSQVQYANMSQIVPVVSLCEYSD